MSINLETSAKLKFPQKVNCWKEADIISSRSYWLVDEYVNIFNHVTDMQVAQENIKLRAATWKKYIVLVFCRGLSIFSLDIVIDNQRTYLYEEMWVN